MIVFSRIQWAKPHPQKFVGGFRIKERVASVTVYDGEGGFVARLDDPKHIAFLNRVIIEALRRIKDDDLERVDTSQLEEGHGQVCRTYGINDEKGDVG